MASRSIQITAGAGGQIQVFQNGTDLGYFRGTKTISANDGDNISVWCDADTGYTFTNLCTPDGTCTTSRPFNFVVNMDISMTATFTSTAPPCTQQDSTFLINGKSGKITVTPNEVLNVTVRNTNATANTCIGQTPTWGVISRSGPVNPTGTEVRVDSGTNHFDSNGCGSTSLVLSVEGTYLLVARWCCVWNSLTDPAHCVEADADIPNVITVVVSSSTPAPTTRCDPATYPPDKYFCIAGTGVPKSYVLIGGAAILLYMLTRE